MSVVYGGGYTHTSATWDEVLVLLLGLLLLLLPLLLALGFRL